MPKILSERIGPAPRIAVDHAGAGPLVVFLHGVGGNRTNWTDQIAALADAYKTVAWDARGWGGSDDYEGPLTYDDFSADLIRVLDYFAAERAVLVGLSMGGRIALDFYGRNPDRVAALVLTATSAGLQNMMGDAKRQDLIDARRRSIITGGTMRDMALRVAPGLVSPKANDAARNQLIESLAVLRKDSYLKALETVLWYEDFPPFDSIDVPTLIVSGTDDDVCTPEMSARAATEIKEAERVLFEDCGHLVNLEFPERYNAVLRDFLERQAHRASIVPAGAMSSAAALGGVDSREAK